MTIPSLSFDALEILLNESGFEEESNIQIDDPTRVVYTNGQMRFILQVKKVYYYPFICRLCERLNIKAPPDHQRCYDQVRSLKERD